MSACLDLEHADAKTVYVVGASDGKFVLPLARRVIHVRAIERDHLALDGGPITLPGPVAGTMAGLRRRLATEHLTDQVKIIEADLLTLNDHLDPADAVWTSCSWHYSINHHRPLGDFLTMMQTLCRPDGGVLGAEYMMPVHPRHLASEHYPETGELRLMRRIVFTNTDIEARGGRLRLRDQGDRTFLTYVAWQPSVSRQMKRSRGRNV